MDKKDFIEMKQERRAKKKTEKRAITGQEVLYIFERVLEGWKTIRIYNTMIQVNPLSHVDKKRVEHVATGNCKVYPHELSPEEYKHYLDLREKVYQIRL
jgi:DNA-binding ferritin-like protein (Dps family)